MTAHGQRSEVCRARRHRVHRQRAYCYRRRWPTGRCRRSNPARRCVSRDGPHLAEHSVKHPVKHCETHRQSVTKRRQPPLPGAPTDPLPCRSPCPRKTPGLACRHQSLPLRRASPRQAQTPRQLSKGLPTTWLHPGARKTPESNRERRICSRLPVPRPVREHPALRMTTPIRSPEPTRMRRRTFPCRPWHRKTTNIR